MNNFNWALQQMLNGNAVFRASWNENKILQWADDFSKISAKDQPPLTG